MVFRGLFLVFLSVAYAQSWDEAVRLLAPKVGTHLAANETAHVTFRNASSLSQADAGKVQSSVERALRRRVRNPTPVEVALTVSENLHGYLLVAQVRQGVEMEPFQVRIAGDRPKTTIDKRMLWEQETPILDAWVMDDQMLILDSNGLTRYENRTWTEALKLPGPLPRDARGRLQVANESLMVEVPGSSCQGTWKPLVLTCESGGAFTLGRNTMEAAGWPPYFSEARIGDTDVVAEADGRVHVYDSAHMSTGAFDGWGGDVAATCDSTRILATTAADWEAADSLALYELVNRLPVRTSDPVEFPGPVTALSSTVAVARNLSTGRYEAYSLTVDCGR